VAGGDEGVRQLLTQDGDGAPLVLGPDEAIEKGDRDRPDASRLEGLRGSTHLVLVERYDDLAVVAHALGHFQAQVARHQCLGFVGLYIV
jgi:hypothetical protein